MTHPCPIRIPTYTIDAAPSVEIYETNDALMESIFGAFFEQLFLADGRLHAVPAMPQFSAMCRALPGGLEVSVMKTKDRSGRDLGLPVPAYTALLAMQQDQSADLSRAALVRAAEVGHSRIHPECAATLSGETAIPFVVIIPHGNVPKAEGAGLISEREVLLSRGLVNQFVGDVFDRFEVTPSRSTVEAAEVNIFFDLDEDGAEMTPPLGELIINPGGDSYPLVHGFLSDAGQEVICVEFPRDGSAVLRSDRDRLALDAATLAALTEMRLNAVAFWEKALTLIEVHEHKLAALRRTSPMAALPDPLTQFYAASIVGPVRARANVAKRVAPVSRTWNWADVPTLY